MNADINKEISRLIWREHLRYYGALIATPIVLLLAFTTYTYYAYNPDKIKVYGVVASPVNILPRPYGSPGQRFILVTLADGTNIVARPGLFRGHLQKGEQVTLIMSQNNFGVTSYFLNR